MYKIYNINEDNDIKDNNYDKNDCSILLKYKCFDLVVL